MPVTYLATVLGCYSPIADRKGTRLMASLIYSEKPPFNVPFIHLMSPRVDNKPYKCMRLAASVCR